MSASRLRETSFTQSDFAHLIGEWPIDGEFYSCFISYSSRDEAFAVSLRTSLESQGVKCWFAPAHMRIGDSISQRIRDEIYRHDRLLLILSRDAADSNWVRQEVDVALERERLQQRHVLLPIELDEASASTTREWVASIRQTRHIAAFRARPGEEAYQLAVARLLRELKPAPSVQ